MWRYATRAVGGAAPLCATLLAANYGAPTGRARTPAHSSAVEADETGSTAQRMLRQLQLLALYSGNSALHCEAATTSEHAAEEGARYNDLVSDENEEEGAGAGLLNPGDFNHREDDKSFNVSPGDGIMLLMQSTIGQPGRDSAALATQLSMSASGVSQVWILSDQKSPGLQAVVQPGPQGGKLIKVAVNGRPAAVPGLAMDAETLLASTGAQSLKSTSKYNGDDFYASLSMSPYGQGPANAEFNYHQALAPGWTAGGTLALAFAELWPLPTVQKAVWGTYGSWTEPRRRDKAVHWRWGAQPNPDGSETQSLNLQTWHRAGKGLELGANLNVTTFGGGGPAWMPLPIPAALADSTAGVGARMTFEGPGGLNPVLLAHMTTGGVASLQWQKPSASGVTNTFMRTTLSAQLDHPKRDYKWGVQLELYY